MTAATLTIGHANVLSSNPTPRRALKAIHSAGADSFGLNEGYRLVPQLKAWRDYRLTVNNNPGRAQETPLLTRGRHPSFGQMCILIADGVPAVSRLAPPRWATVDLYEHPLGDVAHINVHLHAGVLHGQLEAVLRDYAQSVKNLGGLIELVRDHDCIPIVSGDVNLTTASKAQPYSPHALLERLGLEYWTQGLDLIAWPKRRLELKSKRLIPQTQTGSDHPFMVATLVEPVRGQGFTGER